MKDVVSIVFQGRIWEHLWVTSTKAAFFGTKLLKGAYLESRWCPICKAKVAGFGVKLPKKIRHLAFQVVDCFHQKEPKVAFGLVATQVFFGIFNPLLVKGKLFPLFDVRIYFSDGVGFSPAILAASVLLSLFFFVFDTDVLEVLFKMTGMKGV